MFYQGRTGPACAEALEFFVEDCQRFFHLLFRVLANLFSAHLWPSTYRRLKFGTQAKACGYLYTWAGARPASTVTARRAPTVWAGARPAPTPLCKYLWVLSG